MVYASQAILSLLSLSLPWTQRPQLSNDAVQTAVSVPHSQADITKSVAIVGAGSAGLSILKALLDLPEEERSTWEIVLYEQRRDVGGVWLPDPNAPRPPRLPETPLYPLLHTNTPHPTMTYPGFTFRPNTPLFPSHEYVQQYHADYAEHFNLTQFIRVNHTVQAAGWKGNSTHGKWIIDVGTAGQGSEPQRVLRKSFDHLIVANGHNQYPREPHWDGEAAWLANTPTGAPKREILHSVFYREPENFINRTVVVVGGGASGRDAVLQVGKVTRVSYRLLDFWLWRLIDGVT